MINRSDFDYKRDRNYSTTSAISAYDTDGYRAEINDIWNIIKNLKNMKTTIHLQPNLGVTCADHTNDWFSEFDRGDLITLDPTKQNLFFLTQESV